MLSTHWISFAIVSFSICMSPSLMEWGYADEPTTWMAYGADKANSKYSPLTQINRDNVKRLRIAWQWESPANQLADKYPELKQFIYESTPLFVDGVLYATTTVGQVAAIHPASGRTLWMYDPKSYVDGQGVHGGAFIHRGAAYWSDGEFDERILIGTLDGRLIALDARTGAPIRGFGCDGEVDLKQGLERVTEEDRYGLTSPPIVVRDVVVVGASITDANPKRYNPRGDVRGFDVRTGELRWLFRSIPAPDEFGNETWENDSAEFTGNTNVWTMMSGDEDLGYVYLPFSTPTNDWYGGDRHGDNLFAESLVCLDVMTGERVWHFQMVHHGLWDYDLASAPNLVDITVDGRPVKAVAQVSKQGFCYVFNRETGEPIWPIHEVPVPPSTVAGEKAAATQPFPSVPSAFERQGVSDADLIDFTPELKAEAQQIVSEFKTGPLFTPPTLEPFIQLPGALGGANWNGAAFDPESQILYIPSITLPSYYFLRKPNPGLSDARFHVEFFQHTEPMGPRGLPLIKPPYGRVTAIDLKTGSHLWQIPLGTGPVDHPAIEHLNLKPLGWSHRGAPLVTKELLFLGQEGRAWDVGAGILWEGKEYTNQEIKEINHFDPTLYVFDKQTGHSICEIPMPMNITNAPMTYMYDGKQYIVVAMGGVVDSAKLVALALP
jgi:quinoprotein glucose dehydrogenase